MEPQLLGKVGFSAEGQGKTVGSCMSLLRSRARPLRLFFHAHALLLGSLSSAQMEKLRHSVSSATHWATNESKF